MDINKILSADILDILFEGRNKQYGAYELRKTYNSRLTKALLITAALALFIFLASFVAGMVNKQGPEKIEVLETEMAKVNENEPPPPPPPPPPPTPPPPPELKQIKFTPPVIKPDDEVKEDEKIKDLEPDAAISNVNVESNNTEQIVQAPVVDAPVEAPKGDDENQIFTKVEIEAEFPGGNKGWTRYLEKNLNANSPSDNGAPPGTYKVIVRFIVSKDGSLSSIECEQDPGYGACEEAIRTIKRGPKWSPGKQNGRDVISWRRQPISFVVAEE